ncbi:CBS domain-containing protein [Candidatus Amarobacter glycogenicus]|uniref:CBS domain-containing protein n=1 Tax=Candidatus Amarobacter glycogenicus TaxID=3140699 RepID=UPI002A105E73|nr:CBS domain-containing protein [Dehalococcoidia bacterium]
MTTPVPTVTEDCPVEEAARIMIQHRIGCLPVMQGATLVGASSIRNGHLRAAWPRRWAPGRQACASPCAQRQRGCVRT